MKTLAIITCFFLAASGTTFAQQKYNPEAEVTPQPAVTEYNGAHGPFYNGTLSDPTIPPRSAVPVGSLKGIKRNFTDQVIEGDPSQKSQQMAIGDDMQTTPKRQPSDKRKPRWEPQVW